MLKSLLKRVFAAREASGTTAWLVRAVELQRAGRHAEVLELCAARLARDADDPDAQQMLASALLAQGRTAEGLAALEKAASMAPQSASVHAQLGHVYAAVGDLDAALASYREAHTLRPDLAEPAAGLATLLAARDAYDEAEERLRDTLAHASSHGALRHRLGRVLFEQGRVDEALAQLRASLALGESAVVRSDLLRTLNYADAIEPEAIFDAHREWARLHAEPLSARALPPPNVPQPGRRLKVGYVSPYFRKHAVTFFLESVLEHHDRAAFEVLLYADVPKPDEYSERLRAHGARWRSTVGADDEALANTVREDGIDILVDLSGHTPQHRLLAFARRPAPVQVTWNGYPNTTGMTAMDYRVTDARCDPPGATERFHTETLARLPEIFMSWRPPADAPDPGPAPCVAAGHVTFGSFNACYKISPSTVRLWSRVLNALPASRLVLFTVCGARAAERLRHLFAQSGVGTDRIDLHARVSHEAFLEAHREVDIALDAYPYHGTTTTCFSLWMGVPVVSLAGAVHASRVGLSLLSSISLPQLAAGSPDEYVHAAVTLARDPAWLANLRATLRERMLRSPLTDGAACAAALERAYRTMWTHWCAAQRRSALR